MRADDIKSILNTLTHHHFLEIVPRGNAAITAALSIFPKGSTVLIPEEGGWIHYKKAPVQFGLKIVEVKCDEAKINLIDIREKIDVATAATRTTPATPIAFLYQNPGGYFAEQPMKEIYALCQKHHCLVIMDVSGSLGTPLGEGQYADLLVGSFGKEKLVDAAVGGFISARDKKIWEKIVPNTSPLLDEIALSRIYQKLMELPPRITHLTRIRQKIIQDLSDYTVLYPKDPGLVVVVAFSTATERERIIDYCQQNAWPYTECPRYIRVKRKAISIEVKRL